MISAITDDPQLSDPFFLTEQGGKGLKLTDDSGNFVERLTFETPDNLSVVISSKLSRLMTGFFFWWS
jgi:hypothetical protein